MELLRIFAMFMIVVYHIYCHCIRIQLTDMQSIWEKGNGWFCDPGFSFRVCILAIIAPMGQIGNAVFLIISGYFMAEKETIDLTKVSKKLLLQLGFAACALGIASIYAFNNITDIPINLMSFNAFNSMSWYIGYYFMVLVVAKLFLNNFLKKLSQKNYIMFMVVVFALLQFSWSVGVISNLGGGLEILCTGIFLYSLGGYIKQYNPFEKIRWWAVLALIGLINVFVIGDYYLTIASRVLEFNPAGEETFTQVIPVYQNNQLVPLVIAIAIFELFRRINIPSMKIINFIGASTFMVYLVHDNELVYKIWNIQDWITPLHDNLAEFGYRCLLWAAGTFGAGVIVYCAFVLGGILIKSCTPLVIKNN